MKRALQQGIIDTRDPFNIYTIAHTIVGFSAGFAGLHWKYGIPLVILWELVEQLILVPLGICWPPELLLDSILDVIVGLIGYCIGYGIRSQVKHMDWYKNYFDVFGKDDVTPTPETQ